MIKYKLYFEALPEVAYGKLEMNDFELFKKLFMMNHKCDVIIENLLNNFAL